MNKETKKLQKLVGKRKTKKVVFQTKEYNQYKGDEGSSDFEYECN